MPFGLDLKSIILGMLLAYFALPWILGLLHKPATTSANV